MAKNFDNVKDQDTDDTIMDGEEVQLSTDDPGFADDLLFDDDGNIIDNGFDADEEELDLEADDDEDDTGDVPEDFDEEDDDEEESDEEEEEEQPKPKSKKKRTLSPADIKVIEMKKQQKRLLQKNKELEAKVNQKTQQQEEEDAVSKYIAQGESEEDARKLAATDLRFKSLEQRQERLDFREANEDVFAKYPNAKREVDRIMKAAKASGMTAEQVCRGLYGGSNIPDRDIRARASANGEYSRDVNPNAGRLSNAQRTAQAVESMGLTAEERRHKTRLERIFNDGKRMSDKDFREIQNR